MAETADGEEPEEQRTSAQIRAELKRELEAELAQEEALQDSELVWELDRLERAAVDGIDDPEEREAAVQEARVAWIQERRLEAQLEERLAARVAKKQAEQLVRERKRFRAAYGPSPTAAGFGAVPPSSARELSQQDLARQKLHAGVRLTADESAGLVHEWSSGMADELRAHYWQKVRGPYGEAEAS